MNYFRHLKGLVLGLKGYVNKIKYKMSLRNRIIAKEVIKDPEKLGGLWIPGTIIKSYKEMKVVRAAVGSLPKGLEENDIVYVKPNCGSPITIDGENLAIINRGDVILIE
jgi:co-chaperonin GroES (HSP10)